MKFTDQIQVFVDDTNKLINAFIEENRPSVMTLGPRYSTLSPSDAASQLRLYRMCKKWSLPSGSDASRAQDSVRAMFDYDANGPTEFSVSTIPNEYLRYQLNNPRYSLQRGLRNFKLDYSEFDMPSGETSVSSNGHTSVWAKLKDPSQWCCSSSALPYFTRIVYNSPSLKYAFRMHVLRYGRMKRLPGENGFETFSRYFTKFVQITEVSRITTVPKDASVDRVILCEPMGNMIVERCIAKSIISFIKREFGVSLEDSQDVHKYLISMDSNATIDLSKASDSNWMCVIRFMLGDTPLFRLLDAVRIPTVCYKQTYHHLNMISPMGNGFTFEVMTLILLAVTRQFDDFSHVFGDDIVVHNEVAGDVIDILHHLGYKINTSKTFVDSPFRESCGGFYSGGYITSFDFWYANNIVEAVVNVNKLGILSSIDTRYANLYREIVDLAPVSLLGAWLYFVPFKSIEDKHTVIARHYGRDYINILPNRLASDHIVVHPRYLEKRRRSCVKGKVKPSHDRQADKTVKVKSTPYQVHVRGKKVNRFFPRSNLKGFLLCHFLYAGLVDPTIRRERIVFS